MKKTTLLLVLALSLLGFMGPASAATTDTITVTVSLASVISVSLDSGAWNIGAITLGVTSGSPIYIATNDGNVNIDLAIACSDGLNGWTVGTVGSDNVFQVDVTSPELTLLTTDLPLATGVAPLGTKTFDMTYTAPTSDTQGGGVDHTFTITITASLAV